MSPRARKKFSFSPPIIRPIEFSVDECPIPLDKYIRDDGSLDYQKMPEAEFQVFTDWAFDNNPMLDAPPKWVPEFALEIEIPVKIVECAFTMSQFASVPNFDLSKAQYTIPTDLGHIGALREEGGKLPRLSKLLRSSVQNTQEALALFEAGFENQFCGKAEPKGSAPEAPNPLLGHVLKMADDDCRLCELSEAFYEVVENMETVLGELADLAEDAREKISGRGGNTKEPDWMVWVARLFGHNGIEKLKYLTLMEKMKAGDSGEAAWKRANSQSARDEIANEDHDSPLPPIPWGSNVWLYESLGGVLPE